MDKVVLTGHLPLRNSISKALNCAEVYEIKTYHEVFNLVHDPATLNIKRNHVYPWYKKVN